jgi:cell division topological specificity factor
MNLFRFFSKPQSAPAARERLQVLLAHERASVGDSDLVSKLRDEILRVISKHMQINDEKVSVKMERGDQVSTLEVDIEIPFDAAKKAEAVKKAITGKKDDPGKKAA